MCRFVFNGRHSICQSVRYLIGHLIRQGKAGKAESEVGSCVLLSSFVCLFASHFFLDWLTGNHFAHPICDWFHFPSLLPAFLASQRPPRGNRWRGDIPRHSTHLLRRKFNKRRKFATCQSTTQWPNLRCDWLTVIDWLIDWLIDWCALTACLS